MGHKSWHGPLPAMSLAQVSGLLCTRRKRRATPSRFVFLRRTCACCLTPRSAPTRYGRPACPCGALVYPAPHGQAVPPPRSVLARALGSTGSIAAHHHLSRASPRRHALRTGCRWLLRPTQQPTAVSFHRFALRPASVPPGPQVVARAAISTFSRQRFWAALYAAHALDYAFSVRFPRLHLRVLPNPSLGTDPLRRASLPVRRAGLCCTTRASRPASAAGVSSNVRRLKPMSFVHDYQREFKRQSQRGRCLHYSKGERCDEIVSAHSIQKSAQLSLIAEAGHVYRLSADLAILQKTEGVPGLKRVGVNRASAFVGFCKHHDNTLFEPIDNFPLGPVKEQIALYAYRCLCREYFVKENAVAVLSRMKDHPALDAPQRQFLAASQVGHSLGFSGLKHHKSIFDDALRVGDYDQFEFTYFTSSSPCPVQLSGLLYPDYDFEGTRLQDLGNHEKPLDLITFFTAPIKEGWAFGFGWHASSNRTCIPFIQSLAQRSATGEKIEDALLRFSLSCCENHAVRISWWDGLSEASKAAAIERMYLMMHPGVPVPDHYLAVGCEGIANWKYEYVHTTLHAAA